MCNYTLTVLITKTTDMTDAGQWQMCMAWKKRITIPETGRGKVIALRDLLNGGRAPYDLANATHNKTMWQWEYPASHSTQILQPLREAGIDWPGGEDTIPDIKWPSITVNLSLD